MSMSHFHRVVTIAVLFLLTIPLVSPWQKKLQQPTIFVTIQPPEATVRAGQTQRFKAVVKGTESTGVRWEVEEQDGGRITEEGMYFAPRLIGIYHVVAISKADSRAKGVAKVIVVMEYDTPELN